MMMLAYELMRWSEWANFPTTYNAWDSVTSVDGIPMTVTRDGRWDRTPDR